MNKSEESLSETNNNTKDENKIDKQKTIIPVPECCRGEKCSKCRKISKYVYVIGVIIIGFIIVSFQQIWPSFDDWLDDQQRIILSFLVDENVIYILLVLMLITFLKSIGVKDVLGLRTISVVILSYKICPNPPFLTLVISMFIIGILSSISKLIEYQVIGHELQVVQGWPVEFVFKYARIILTKCIAERHLVWLDPKYTFAISELSRKDKSMDVVTDFKDVVDDLIVAGKCCCKKEDDSNDDEVVEKVTSCLCNSVYYTAAVIWTSVVEWIQPITEFFLYAHNWEMSVSNVFVIVFSEFADFDKMVEAWFLVQGIRDGDIIDAKVKALASRGVFWTVGYLVVMPISLIWAYLYAKKNNIVTDDDDDEDEDDEKKKKTEAQRKEEQHNENDTSIQMEEKNDENRQNKNGMITQMI